MFARLLVLACVLALFGEPCAADDEFDGAREAAARVAAAAKAKDDAALRELAAKPGADPWLVVDALLEAKLPEVARAFAAAHEGSDAEALRAVAARGLREPSDARTRLAEAAGKLDAPLATGVGSDAVAAEVLASLKGVESIPEGVLRVRWLMTRASASRRAEHLRDCAADLGRAAEVANRAGWTSRAAALWDEAALTAHEDHDARGALAFWRKRAELLHTLGDRTHEAETLANVAELHQRFGETRDALLAIRQALEGLPAEAPPALRETLRARLGALLAESGDVHHGLAELTSATEQLKARGDGERLAYADACLDLGHVRRTLGDSAGARRSFLTSLEAYERLDAAESTGNAAAKAAGIAAAKANLAAILVEEGRAQEAYDELQAQRESFQAIRDVVLAARTLQAMADTRLRQAARTSDRDRRRRWLDDARSAALAAITESQDAHDAECTLRARGNLGEAEEGLKHTDEAIRLYEAVVAEADLRGLSDIVLEYSGPLARARLHGENPIGAIEAVERGFSCLARSFGNLGDQTRIQAHERNAALFELGMRAALQKDAREGTPLFLRFLELGRATALLDSLENRDLLRARQIPPALEAARLDAARALTEQRAALKDVGDDVDKLSAVKAEIAEAREVYEKTVDAIQEDARQGAHLLYPEPVSLADVQRKLTPTEALVLYVVIGADARALLVTRETASVLDLGAAEPAIELCTRSLVRSDDPEAMQDWRKAEEAIWTRIDARLPAAVNTVYISPDGNLGLVPFPALPVAGKKRTFSFVPSASTFALLRDRSTPRGEGTLAVGIKDYDALARSDGAALLDRGALNNLDAAEDEASTVGAGEGSRVLLGSKATEEAVLATIAGRARWSALHFAVHGLPDARNPACLALAPSSVNDGDLTAFDILLHDVPADVAVLAACDSAGGGYVRGEGLVGLVRAFIFSGCPCVIANLWNARDDAAKTFSIAFHKEWRKGAGVSGALEAARAEVRKNPKWQHPFFWAGWCVWGAAR